MELCQTPNGSLDPAMQLWSAAATCSADTSGTGAVDFADKVALCPDCMGQLKAWLAGGQTEDLSIAEDIIRDMYAALGVKPRRQQACEYLSRRYPATCARCVEDPAQCVDEMFDDIRYCCSEIGIDLEGDEDAKQ